MKVLRNILIISLVILSSLLLGCKQEESNYVYVDSKVFEADKLFESQYILIDKETGVQYIYIGGFRRAGLTVRLDADGKPMVANK